MGSDQALKKLTTGIYVVTSKQGAVINGMVASWVSQVSFSPPLIMVAIKQGRHSHGMIREGKVFCNQYTWQKTEKDGICFQR